MIEKMPQLEVRQYLKNWGCSREIWKAGQIWKAGSVIVHCHISKTNLVLQSQVLI